MGSMRSRVVKMDSERERLLNEVVGLDEEELEDLMDQAVMRDIDEKYSSLEEMLLNTPDSVLLVES